jgi:hypothetical protein
MIKYIIAFGALLGLCSCTDWTGNFERINLTIGGTAPVPSFSGIKVAGVVNSVSELWSATKKLSAAENALAHFVKHGKEFDEFYNATQYVKGAKEF